MYGTLPQGVSAVKSSITSVAQGGPPVNLTNTNTTATVVTVQVVRSGFGYVYAQVAQGGTALTVGSALIVNSSQVPAVQGTAVLYTGVGQMFAGVNYTYLQSLVTAGSSVTINVANLAGFVTGAQILVDTGSLQETVTVSGATLATQSVIYSFANNHATNTPLVVAYKSGTIVAVPFATGSTATVLVPAFIDTAS
jgi:hypothetical protein